MKDAAFQELITSVRQAGRIRRGAMKASRTTVFRPADVKAVRAKLIQRDEVPLEASSRQCRRWNPQP